MQQEDHAGNPFAGAGRETRAPEPVHKQLAVTAVGEITAFALGLGGVLMTDKFFPHQTQAFVQKLSKTIAPWTKKDPMLIAKQITDLGVMNLSGAAGVAVQYGISRATQKPEEKTGAGYEMARLITGRVSGTILAWAAVFAAEFKVPKFYQGSQNFVNRMFDNNRVSKVFVDDAIQTLVSIPGNIPAQILFDKVVGEGAPKEKAR